MNQQCKVCGEPAAGFHFGAFTCEGCKSFFGRSYNNLSSISECKNNGECVINKKNRTACKACRLRKCLMVGMSKSGSRYGRRSNWFKIHCLLQEQQQAQQSAQKGPPNSVSGMGMLGHPPPYPPSMFPRAPCTKEELLLLGLDDYKHASTSPSVSSPDSHNSDSSVEVGDRRHHPLMRHKHHMEQPLSKDLFLPLSFPGLGSLPVLPSPGTFLPPPSAFTAHHLLFPGGYHPALYHHQGLLKPANNNSRHVPNNNAPPADPNVEAFTKRFYLDAVLKSQRSPSTGTVSTETEDTETEEICSPPPNSTPPAIQENPMDLSMKSSSLTSEERRETPDAESDNTEDEERIEDRAGRRSGSEADDDTDYERDVKRLKIHRTTPLDLTNKV